MSSRRLIPMLQIGGSLLGGVANPAGSKLLFVDGNRTDTYTPNGTFAFPFKDIQSAINKVISNGDGVANPYVIKVAPATYPGNLTFNSLLLGTLAISNWANLSSEAAITTVNISGTVTSSSTNTNLILSWEGINFSGAITYSGAFSALHAHCNFGGGGSVNANGLTECDFFYCHAQSIFTLASLIGQIRCGQIGAPHTTNINSGATIICESAALADTINVNSGGSLRLQEGCTISTTTTTTVANGGTLILRNSYVGGTLTINAGATVTVSDSFVSSFTGSLSPEAGTAIIGAALLGTATPTVAASQIGLGNTKAATATAGAGAAPPATVDSYLVINDGGTVKKIPLYLA